MEMKLSWRQNEDGHPDRANPKGGIKQSGARTFNSFAGWSLPSRYPL